MSTHPMDRRKAAAYQRFSQGAVGLLLLAGIAVGAVGLPLLRGVPAPDSLVMPVVELPQAGAEKAGSPESRAVDNNGLAARFGRIANAPKAPDAPPADTTKPPDEPARAPAELRFLGVARIGSLTLALVHDGVKQHFVKVGGTLGEYEILEINETSIRVRKGGAERTIDIASKSSEIFTRATGPGGMATRAAAAGLPQQQLPQGVPGQVKPIAGARPAMPPASRIAGRAPVKPAAPTAAPVAQPMESNPGRMDELYEKFKASGLYKSDDEMRKAAKEAYEQELQELGTRPKKEEK